MKANHTKGNWIIKPSLQTTKKRTEIWTDSDIEPTFEIVHNETSIIEAQANAKLISAAPELLEALMIAYDIISLRQSEIPELNKIREAINKATL